MSISYRNPRDNVVIDKVLYIPKEQQTEEYFSYVLVEGSGKTLSKMKSVDNYKDFNKSIIPSLQSIVKMIGIKPIPKKKDELVALLQTKVIFE